MDNLDEDFYLNDAISDLERDANLYIQAAGVIGRELAILNTIGDDRVKGDDDNVRLLQIKKAKYTAMSLACRFAYENMEMFDNWANNVSDEVNKKEEELPEPEPLRVDVARGIFDRLYTEGLSRIEIISAIQKEMGIGYHGANRYYAMFKRVAPARVIRRVGYDEALAIYKEMKERGAGRAAILEEIVAKVNVTWNTASNYYADMSNSY